MKVGKKAIAKDGSGFVQLYPNDDEDLWHLYNLIQEVCPCVIAVNLIDI